MMKKYPRSDLDAVARRHTNGHYVEQSYPVSAPARDKLISEAIAKMNVRRSIKAHQ